jgi:hypothetical protein
MSNFDEYNPETDPVLIAYQNAMEMGDYEAALRIQVGLNSEAINYAAQGAAQEAYAQGQQDGFAEGAAQVAQRSPEEQAEVDARYRQFLGQPEPEAEPTPQQKAAQAIVDAAHSDSYEWRLKQAFRKD